MPQLQKSTNGSRRFYSISAGFNIEFLSGSNFLIQIKKMQQKKHRCVLIYGGEV